MKILFSIEYENLVKKHVMSNVDMGRATGAIRRTTSSPDQPLFTDAQSRPLYHEAQYVPSLKYSKYALRYCATYIG